jgi:hypothetical protein
MTVPLARKALEDLKYPIPDDRGSTRDAIAGLIADAPDFASEFFPDYTIEIGFSMAILGLEGLVSRARTPGRRAKLQACIEWLGESYAAFKAGDKARGMELLQSSYWAVKEG